MNAPIDTKMHHSVLGPDFYDPVVPARFETTILRFRNRRWAERVGLGQLSENQWIDHFAHFTPLPGSFEKPLALRYHGHQFGAYNPDLGDGRGFLFAQLTDPETGHLLDLGTKGSGTTPWSRGGDGRLTLKGGVREILASEMLEALGVNTSKGFSLIETGENLYRNDEPSPARSSVLVRLSHSHIRIGTFQRLAYLEDNAGIGKLLDHCIAHYYPYLADLQQENRASAFLGAVAEAVAQSGAQMVGAGFVHGVLNTDNINITGEVFDYGPWRFLPRYQPGFTAAYFDEGGRYAFGRQPDALAWALTRLAECLVPVSSVEALEPELNRFWPAFQRHMAHYVLARLGLEAPDVETGRKALEAFFGFLAEAEPDYEQVFFDLFAFHDAPDRLARSPQSDLYAGAKFAALQAALGACAPKRDADPEHPYFARSGPVRMLIEDVEAIWTPIAQADDWSGFTAKLEEIAILASAYRYMVDFTAK